MRIHYPSGWGRGVPSVEEAEAVDVLLGNFGEPVQGALDTLAFHVDKENDDGHLPAHHSVPGLRSVVLGRPASDTPGLAMSAMPLPRGPRQLKQAAGILREHGTT